MAHSKQAGETRLKIGIDVDGVLAAFSPEYIDLANEMFGLHLNPEDQIGWAHQSLGLSDAQSDKVWDRINSTPNWWLHLLPTPNTGFLKLAADRHILYFITKRNPTTCGMAIEEQTAHWIRRNFWIPNPTVIVTERKGDVCKALDVDYFIDDKYENCQDVDNIAIHTTVYLQDAPYNREIRDGRIKRVANINAFLQEIGGLYGSKEAA